MNYLINNKSSLGGHLPFTVACIATAGRSMLNMSSRKSDSLNEGDVFGKLVFVRALGSEVGGGGKKEHRSLFKCECGREKSMVTFRVVSGASRSCGCVNKGEEHGMTGTKIYYVWGMMRSRCTNPHTIGSELYAKRGIEICDEWKNSFPTFYKWAIANGYKEGLEIDRINNNGNYEPDNCRWVTKSENCNNRRDNVWVEYNGERLPLSIAIRKFSTMDDYQMIQARIRSGWSFERAITTPRIFDRRKSNGKAKASR